MSKKITLLGSTGSIGTQSLDVIRAQGYEVFGLSAHSHVEKILEQIEEFHPRYVCMTDPDAAARLDAALAGRAFGRHKLAPIVSPHKTVEGAVGGVLGSMAAGCVLTLVYSLLSAKYNVISIQVQPKHYLVLLGMGAVASVLGILGDLFASSVKRQVGIKDYGTIFPGHGGILDRFDSVMFIAPFVSIAVRYFFYLL